MTGCITVSDVEDIKRNPSVSEGENFLIERLRVLKLGQDFATIIRANISESKLRRTPHPTVTDIHQYGDETSLLPFA